MISTIFCFPLSQQPKSWVSRMLYFVLNGYIIHMRMRINLIKSLLGINRIFSFVPPPMDTAVVLVSLCGKNYHFRLRPIFYGSMWPYTCENCSWYLCGLFSGRFSGHMGVFGCTSERCIWSKENHSRGTSSIDAVIDLWSLWNYISMELKCLVLSSFLSHHYNFQAQYLAEAVSTGLGNTFEEFVGKVFRRWMNHGGKMCMRCFMHLFI